MKALLSLVILLTLPLHAQVMQQAITHGNTPPVSCSPALVDKGFTFNTSGTTGSPLNTTGANLLVAIITGSGTSTAAPTDSNSNTWTAGTQYGTSGQILTQLYYAFSPTVGTSHSFTNNAGGGSVLQVAAFSGMLAGSGVFDAHNGNSIIGTTSTIQPGSVTPSQGCELVVTGVGTANGSQTFTVDTGFTTIQTINSFAPSVALAYLVPTGAGALNPTWTPNTTSSVTAANIVTFKQ